MKPIFDMLREMGLQGVCVPVSIVASTLQVSEKTIYRLIRRGGLRHVRIGRVIRVPVEALTALVDGQTAGAEVPRIQKRPSLRGLRD